MPTRKQEEMWKSGSMVTNVEHYASEMDDRPFISAKTLKSLSQERQMMLESDINNGMFKGGPQQSQSRVAYHSSGMVKTASPYSMNGFTGNGGGYKGSGNTAEMNPQIYSPFIQNQNLNLPRQKDVVNAWARAFFVLNPIVQNAINLHSSYPISKLNMKCHNKKVETFFSEMSEELNLLNICIQICQEYWLLGEAFPYADWDEANGKWSRLFLQNPDYIVVKKTLGEPSILIKPDENLKNIVMSNKPSDIAQRRLLPQDMVQSIKKGENIATSNFNISHIARILDTSNVRGTGLVNSVFKQLMLMDLIRESEYVQFQDMINPLMLISIGNNDARLGPEHLEAYRQVFEQAVYNKDFKIFTHDGVKVEMVNKGSGIYDTNAKYTQLLSELYTGLMVPKIVIEGGGDITYGNAGVTLDVLKQRYITFRNILSKFLRKKIFAPVAYANDFYEYKDGEKILVIPEIEWNHLSLFDTADYVNQLVSLSSEGEGKRVSKQTLYRSLGLDFEDEERKMRQERIKNAIAKKESEVLGTMSLNDLRAVTDDTEIEEKVNEETGDVEAGAAGGGLPGAGLPGSSPSPDLSGAGLGGPPPPPPPEPSPPPT
jgi:hypothetical protein